MCWTRGILPSLLAFAARSAAEKCYLFKFARRALCSFGILADLTPPVAVAAYAASGISQGDPFRTGVRAFSLALAEVYVPFAFVFSPILILFPWILDKPRGPFSWLDFIFLSVTVILGIMALGALIIGYLADRTTKLERLLIFLALLGLWWHDLSSSIAGFLPLAGVYVAQCLRKRREEKQLAPSVMSAPGAVEKTNPKE